VPFCREERAALREAGAFRLVAGALERFKHRESLVVAAVRVIAALAEGVPPEGEDSIPSPVLVWSRRSYMVIWRVAGCRGRERDCRGGAARG
jgi:hypothetical protein